MKKLFSILLIVCVLFSTLCVQVSAVEPVEHDIIYFDATNSGWSDYTDVYFNINKPRENNTYFPYMSEEQKGVYVGNGIYSYDLTDHGIVINDDYIYTFYCYNDKSESTYVNSVKTNYIGCVAYCSDKTYSATDNRRYIYWRKKGSTPISLKYEDRFVDYMHKYGLPYNSFEEEGHWYDYGELYSYYSANNTTQTPDWVLVFGAYIAECPMLCYGVFGDYIVSNYSWYTPFSLGYGVYVPSEDRFYSLTDAWGTIDNIELVFSECLAIGKRWNIKILGDNDGDGSLTVMDATVLQRALANICYLDDKLEMLGWNVGPEKLTYSSDFDRDGERTIMDATAIQRKLAKLD